MTDFLMRYAITPRYLTGPSKRRPRRPLDPGVRFVVVHDTGNPGSTADQNVRYYERSRNEMSASAHLFVDDRQILECIPALTGPPEKAWHVLYKLPTDDRLFGFDANDAAIGVEYCFGAGIDADEAYRKYVWTVAYLCYRFALDPSRAVVGHFFLDPQRKTDPVTGLAQSRRTYEQLLRDIVAEHAACRQGVEPPAPTVTEVEGMVVAMSRLNIRHGAPSRRAPVVQVVGPGTELVYVGLTREGEPVNGNPVWYRTGVADYFWSGGTSALL
jgi:N-acetylmuramoyl-L-alanine amidase CwlA